MKEKETRPKDTVKEVGRVKRRETINRDTTNGIKRKKSEPFLR
ncbi:MAG: hypothetical protein ACPLRS_00595 [Hydrogenobacter sp.]